MITAHLNVIDNSDLLSSIITHIWAIIARFGVPCFLITGGYYYHREKNDTISFWRKKIFSVLIPWIIASFFTYTMHSVLHKSWSIIGYLKWFVGSNSLYYYMTVYVIMLVLFKFVTKTPHLVMMIFLTFGSLVLEQMKIYNDYGHTLITSYLNPLNWVGFFAFGILIRRFGFEKKVDKPILIISFTVLLGFAAIELYLDQLSYFSIFNPITQTALLIILFGLFNRIQIKDNSIYKKIILFIGTNSLIIYLYHIQIVQFSLNRLLNAWFIYLIRPFLGLFIMVVLIYVGYTVLKLVPFGKNIMKYIGLKKPK